MLDRKKQISISLLLTLCGILIMVSATACVVAVLHWDDPNSLLIFVLALVVLIATGFTFSKIVLSTIVSLSLTREKYLEELIEALQMSENAKLVLFRDRELELFRSTVQEDITQGKFHSALVLCDQMAKIYGAVEESEVLRIKVQEIIHEKHEARIRGELRTLTELLNDYKWVDAYQDAARLRRLFPDSPLLHGLEQQIADARSTYRSGLEDRFLEATGREDIEKAMMLLRELDGYLTPDEARRFRDAANVVIAKFRDTLGERFKMSVHDHRWQQVVEFGEEITHQFPNTKMAEEVKVILDTIRVKAEEDEQLS